ncbi:MAG: pyridoxamine 5'-phosphate oxidase [Xenococcus sp. (in: cyanobacteria)]
MNQSVADLRQNYTLGDLTETNVESNPIRQFKLWFEQAVAADIIEPNAMTLATATPDGKPTARIVLLKGFDERGFVFYTNYQSLKGQQAITNPHAALVFFWDSMQRQVRIEGKITKVSAEESDSYFSSRPLGSQIGAWTSAQSQVIANREFLELKQQEIAAQYQNQETIPRPEHWGGFRVIPKVIEFWQGRPNRLHDRLVYRLQPDNSWSIERLSP